MNSVPLRSVVRAAYNLSNGTVCLQDLQDHVKLLALGITPAGGVHPALRKLFTVSVPPIEGIE